MDSKSYRLREFLSPADGRSLVADTSAGLALGTLPGLEDYRAALQPALPLLDGVVASPGMARLLAGRTRGEAALLVRADWTNALRGPDFVLPPEHISRLSLLDPADALDLGASGMVISFLLGYEEEIEAACLRATVQLALNAAPVGLPVLVEVRPTGPRVVLREKAIELGASYALEGGADGIAIPWPGAKSLATILTMAAGLPVWIAAEDLTDGAAAALEAGAAGLWLDHRVFAGDVQARLRDLRSQVHPTAAGLPA